MQEYPYLQKHKHMLGQILRVMRIEVMLKKVIEP